ncbi:retrotransposable element Tf2 [Tanacetum coccineum]
MKWLPKLMGFDYEVIYKQGKDNVVADALSRKEGEGECLHISIIIVSTALYDQVKQTWTTDNQLKAICDQLKEGQIKKHYSLFNDQLLRKGKLVVGTNAQLRQELLNHFHGGSIGGHSGIKATTHKICSLFYWKDFIEGLPKSQGYNVIMVVVDRLTKYAHFMPLAHPFNAVQVAQAFMDNVCKLHGMPESIVFDRDKTDRHTEVVNKCLETYLRCMTGDHPKEWSKWLPLAELCRVYAVDRLLEAREKVVQLLRFHLERDQNRMKQQSDKNRPERVLLVGDWVWLKLQPHRQEKQNKFSPKYYGPFEVISKVGDVAYKLNLPEYSQIHDVFHVSQLNKYEVIVPIVKEDLESTIAKENPRNNLESGNISEDSFVRKLKTSHKTLPLHEAARAGNAEKVLELLKQGFDPCVIDERGRTPYRLAAEKEVMNTFRRFMALNPDKWDWQTAKVPSPLTKEMEESHNAKQANKYAKRKARAKELKMLRKAREKKVQEKELILLMVKADLEISLHEDYYGMLVTDPKR